MSIVIWVGGYDGVQGVDKSVGCRVCCCSNAAGCGEASKDVCGELRHRAGVGVGCVQLFQFERVGGEQRDYTVRSGADGE